MTTNIETNNHQADSISVVVPVFRSEGCLEEFAKRCSEYLNTLTTEWEIILVNDASPDRSWDIACELNAHNSKIKCVRLSRNLGQQYATVVGLHYASKAFVVTIDDDLQCWPEDIGNLIDQLRAGSALVIGSIPTDDKQHHWFRNFGSRYNQQLIGNVLGKPSSLSLSSYRAMQYSVAKKIATYRGAHPHVTAMLLKAVPHELITNVNIRHSPRSDGGQSTYSFRKLLKVMSYLVVNHSYIPLRLMVFWGFFISIISMLFALWVVLNFLFIKHTVPGWASISVLVSFLSGNILMALGILGEYIGRIVEESSHVSQFSVYEERV